MFLRINKNIGTPNSLKLWTNRQVEALGFEPFVSNSWLVTVIFLSSEAFIFRDWYGPHNPWDWDASTYLHEWLIFDGKLK